MLVSLVIHKNFSEVRAQFRGSFAKVLSHSTHAVYRNPLPLAYRLFGHASGLPYGFKSEFIAEGL